MSKSRRTRALGRDLSPDAAIGNTAQLAVDLLGLAGVDVGVLDLQAEGNTRSMIELVGRYKGRPEILASALVLVAQQAARLRRELEMTIAVVSR